MSQDVSDYYEGSRLLAASAAHFGLSVDKFNFVVSQIAALLLASLYRTHLHPSKVKAEIRHGFGLTWALIIGYFCFGIQAIHLAALPAIGYFIIRTQKAEIMQTVILMVSLLYLSLIHIHRQIYDYGSYNLDITGPLMVITQKVTSLAYNLHDGLTRKDEELSKSQQAYAIKKYPTVLEYFSFTLHFPTLMAGPMIFYKDYMDFIDGTNLKSFSDSNISNTDFDQEPSPNRAVYRKVAKAALCAVGFVVFLPMFPIKRAKDADFVETTSITQKFVYLFIATTLVRFKYYFAWTFADAVSNNAGIGYEGVDAAGQAKWDKFTNVNIMKFECATNLKEAIEAWNLGTNRWLRMIVYERVEKNSLIWTYALSAVWHGFYPGYYLTFASGALFTAASRTVRKTIRNYFLANAETKLFYDGITFIVTRLLMTYLTFTFVLLEFWPCIRLYMHMYWCFHLASLFIIFIVPMIIPKTAPNNAISASKSTIAHALLQSGPITNGVSRHHD